MKKNNVRVYVVLAVAFVVFSVIAFAAPFAKFRISFWLAYLFGVVAIAFQLYVYHILGEDDDAKSRFYGFPIARIGLTYLVVQLIISLAEMVLAFIMPAWIPLIINVVLIAVAFIGCIVAESVKEEIERQDVIIKKEVKNIRGLQSLSASLVNQCSDSVKKVVADLAEEIRYSDPVSCDESEDLEKELDNLLKELQQAIIDGDDSVVEELCKRTTGVLTERNRVCKLNK